MEVVSSDVGSDLPVVRLDGIWKRYPGQSRPAVSDLSLDIREGEIFTLLGPSGCGKTTTLRMVAGLETLDRGSIYFRDRPIVVMSKRLFVPPEKREVGMVFQSYAIWPHMSVEENVGYPLKIRRMNPATIRDKVARILDLVGLDGYADRSSMLLSGGQQQRVALARALVYEPSLLLLDEPFSNLDSKLREQMRLEVKLLQTRLKITVLFVTHDQVEALSLSSRIAVMDQGRVQQVGRPRDLYHQPANVFVRDFLGRTVVIRGTVGGHDAAGRMLIDVEGAPNGIAVRAGGSTGEFPPGQAVCLSLRPEDVAVLPAVDAGRPLDGAVRGTVEAELFMGDRTEYRVRLPGQGPVLVYGDEADAIDPGRDVWLIVPADRAGVWLA